MSPSSAPSSSASASTSSMVVGPIALLCVALLLAAPGAQALDLKMGATERFKATQRITGSEYAWELDASAMLKTSNFPISPDALIARAKQVVDRKVGVQDADDLAECFQWQGPVVGPLGKEQYVSALKSFQLDVMFPDISYGAHSFSVDPLYPNCVRYLVNFEGTHTGPSPFGAPTGTKVQLGPQVCSLWFDEEGKVERYTGGYVADVGIGNGGGLGGLFGPLYAIGRPFPFREARPFKPSLGFRLFNLVGSIARKLSRSSK